MKEEIWKSIPGYEGYYEASTFGRIRSVDRTVTCSNGSERSLEGRILKGILSQGYLHVTLYINLRSFHEYVHRLVATTFLPKQHSYLEVNHKDGNKQNNCVDNLEWVTKSQNMTHSFDTGLHKIHEHQKENSRKLLGTKVYCFDNDTTYESMAQCEKDLSISHEQLKSSTSRKGQLSNVGKNVPRYRIVLLQDKNDVTFCEPDPRLLFENRRIIKLHERNEMFTNSSELISKYNLDSSKLKLIRDNYLGYDPDLDDVFYDCGYDKDYFISYDDYLYILYFGKRNCFKSITSKVVRCSNGKVYMSCNHASKCLNVSVDTLWACLRKSGHVSKLNLDFQYVDVDKITNDEVDELYPFYKEKRNKLMKSVKR